MENYWWYENKKNLCEYEKKLATIDFEACGDQLCVHPEWKIIGGMNIKTFLCEHEKKSATIDFVAYSDQLRAQLRLCAHCSLVRSHADHDGIKKFSNQKLKI